MGLGWDPEVLVSFDRLSLTVAENRDERRRGSLVLSGLRGLSPQLATLAALRRHRTTKFGEERSLAAGPANSRILTSSATRAPEDGDFRALTTRSTGFKTYLIPQPAPVPCRSKRAPSTGGTFPDLGLAPADAWGSRERAGEWRLEKPLRQVFLLCFAQRWALVVTGSQRDGQPQRDEPGNVWAAVIRRRGWRGVCFLKKKKNEEKVKLQPGEASAG